MDMKQAVELVLYAQRKIATARYKDEIQAIARGYNKNYAIVGASGQIEFYSFTNEHDWRDITPRTGKSISRLKNLNWQIKFVD
jgi:hypothetical protein